MSESLTSTAAFNARVLTQVLNLDRTPARLTSIAADLDAAAVEWRRFPAIDGAAPDFDMAAMAGPWIDLARWPRRHHRNPIPTEIACYLSHVGALRQFLESDRPIALILEDDAQLDAGFIAAVSAALTDASCWDILKLHARHPGPLITRKRYGAVSLASPVLRTAGATAYFTTRAAAARLLTHLAAGAQPYDWMFDQGYRTGLRLRLLTPAPVTTRAVASTIEINGLRRRRSALVPSTDTPLLPRWSLPFRRGWDETRRVTFNLWADGGLEALLSARPLS